MSKLNIKQIAGPIAGARAGTGAIPVFDGNQIRWSNNASTALQLPAGTTAQRPVGENAVDGMFRYNTELGKIEALQAGSWITAINEIKSILDLTDTPNAYGIAGQVLRINAAGTGVEFASQKFSDLADVNLTGKGGQIVRVNAEATGVEFFPLPLSNMISYSFRINFNGANPNPANLSADVPNGWTVSVQTTDDIVITHNLGLRPAGGMVFGLLSGTNYRSRILSGTMDVQFDINNLNTCMVTNITSTNTGSLSGTHCYLQLWFTV